MSDVLPVRLRPALALVLLLAAVSSPSAVAQIEGAEDPNAGPIIEAVAVLEVSPTEAVIGWDVAPPSTGQVEFGPTTDFGRLSTLETGLLPQHIQSLSGLDPATQYHYRIVAVDAGGRRSVSDELTFTTAPSASQPEAPSGIYGSGIASDAKDNYQLSGRRLAHRFQAGTTSELLSVRVQQRGGEVYSAGDGGSVEVSIQTDDGRSGHRPSGEVLAELTVQPGNPDGDWTTYEAWAFPEPATLTAGELYHVVFENPAPTPADDYISINEIFMWQPDEPRQPALLDEYAVLYDEGDGWKLQHTATANMDLSYADETHDGVAYIHNMCDRYGVIAAPDQLVRERFTVSGGDRLVEAVAVRLKRTSGDEPLTISVERDDGTVLASVDVPAEAVPRADPGCGEGTAGWVTAALEPPLELEGGQTYDLRLNTGRASQYTAEPIREATDQGMDSYRFIDGAAERSSDGGSTWSALYPWSPVDLQFYFVPAP